MKTKLRKSEDDFKYIAKKIKKVIAKNFESRKITTHHKTILRMSMVFSSGLYL